jgi:Na+/H+-dicarboxylate symporter
MLNYYKNHQGQLIIVMVVAAFIFGIYQPQIFSHLLFISDVFINLLKLCALPIVCTSLIVILGRMHTPNQVKTIAKATTFYILCSEMIAVTIGLLLFNWFNVGDKVDAHILLKGATQINNPEHLTINLNQIVNYVIPSNIFAALVKFDVLPLVVFSIIFGITCLFNQEKAQPVLNFFASIRDIFLELLNVVLLIAPLAIFVLIGSSVATSYLNGSLATNLVSLALFVAVFFAGLFLHFLWQIILVMYLYRKELSLKQIWLHALPILITAFISSSSLATLPIAMKSAETMGGNKKVVEFMLPICASMNFASGMMYEVAASLFFIQALHIHVDLLQQILLAITCIITGIAVGGIPETSMLSFITIFNMLGIPLTAISILLPLDRIVDRVRTMVNIFGNTCGTLTVTKIAKLDKE